MTPIQTIIEVTNCGGTFRLHGESMKVSVPYSVTPELTASLRANKPDLIEYLHGDNRNWCLTRSELLGGVLIFFARDEASKETLVRMGASAHMVYTRNELKDILESGASPECISIAHDARMTLEGRFVGGLASARPELLGAS